MYQPEFRLGEIPQSDELHIKSGISPRPPPKSEAEEGRNQKASTVADIVRDFPDSVKDTEFYAEMSSVVQGRIYWSKDDSNFVEFSIRPLTAGSLKGARQSLARHSAGETSDDMLTPRASCAVDVFTEGTGLDDDQVTIRPSEGLLSSFPDKEDSNAETIKPFIGKRLKIRKSTDLLRSRFSRFTGQGR